MLLGSYRLVFAAVVSLSTITFGPVQTARAQVEVPQAAMVPFSPPSTLAAGLKNIEWRAVQRGPLFAVNPQGTGLWRPQRDPRQPEDAPQTEVPKLGPPDGRNNSYRPETLAPYFGRKVTRVGSVTVFAPTEMTVLATNLKGEPDPLAGLQNDEKTKLLQASLTDAQWRQLGSPNGLGVSDMDATQRELFMSVLPNPFIVTEWVTEKNGSMRSPNTNGAPNKTTLTDGERQQVRLRMNRSTQMTIPSTNDKNGGWGEWVNTQSRGEGQSMYQVSQGNDWNRPDAFGVMLKDVVPAHLKPGQLDFESSTLDRDVDLRGAKTVGDLVERIAKASGLEIIADARVARLSLWVYGDPIAANTPPVWVDVNPTAANTPPVKPAGAVVAGGKSDAGPPDKKEDPPVGEPAPARAGDALKALCWAVTGTVRKVGPVYVLTDDLEGIGARQARISQWTSQGNARKEQILSKYDESIRAHQPLQYTNFAPGDKSALDSATMSKVEGEWGNSRGRYRGVTKPTTELGDDQQKLVRQAIENHQMRASRGEKNVQPIVLDSVRVTVGTKMMYVLPGGKEADCNIYLSLNSFLPPPKPESWDGKPLPSTDPVAMPAILERGGMLMASPRTLDEVRLVMDTAKEHGLRGVWLPINGLEGQTLLSNDLLKQAAQMGKEKKVPVTAVVRLLLAPVEGKADEASTADASRNVSVTGQTGGQLAAIDARLPEQYSGARFTQTTYIPRADWLRPDAPLTAALLKRKLLEIADIPNLAGIVIKNAAAPGYEAKDTGPYSDSTGSDFGYTLENRLACLRATHIDPIDFGSAGGYGDNNLSLPFFADGRAMSWSDDGTMKVDNKALAPRSAWKSLRFDQTTRLLTGLFQAFRAAQPTMPLYLSDFDRWYGTGTVIAWKKGDALPVSVPYDYSDDGNNLSELTKARKLSDTVFMNIPCGYAAAPRYPYSYDDGVAPGSGKSFARTVNRYLKPIQDIKNAVPGSHLTWDGVILDFGEVPVATVADLLKDGMATPDVPTRNAANR